nr:retrovirus-related Pol polyprotein from transposon TNT 1-94 [Tanacetum cinerariifolium]
MSTQQDIYAAGSESRPPMLNKENYGPWSSRLLRYAKSRPNGKSIHNSILNGLYVRKMILEPGDANREITTILLGLPEDIYAVVNTCETAQEIWLRVQQMMKGSDIGIQEKKAKLFNEWESRHVTIIHQTKDLHTADYTQLYDFRKYNQKEVDELKVERLAKTQDPLALMANSNNPYVFPAPHQDQSSFNQNYLQQPIPNPEDITDPTTTMNMALSLMAKAFKLNYSTPTNNNQRISSNPRNRQIAQPGMNMSQDRLMQMVGGNGGNQFRQYAGQNARNPAVYNDVIGNQVIQNAVQNLRVQNGRNQNGFIGVQGNGNQNQIGNGHYARNCTVKPRRMDATYLQTQLLIAQKEEIGIQLQAEEYDLMAAAEDLDEIEEVNANCILMANLQQASTSDTVVDCSEGRGRNPTSSRRQASSSGTLTDSTPVYDSDGSAEVHENNDNNVISEVTDVEQGGEIVEQHPANFEETRALYDSLYHNLAVEVEKLNSVNRKLKETNADLTIELASTWKQIMTLNEQISDLNKQLSKEKSTVSFLLEEKKKLKSDFKTYEDELLDKQFQLKKKIMELNNIVLKTGQSIQMIHMLSPKPDSFYHTEQKMALGYQNPFYLKQAQKKHQSLYDGKVLLEKHDPLVVHDSEETLQLAQKSRDKMKQMNKEIKPANYTKINHLSGGFVPQKALSREELYFLNNSKTVNISKSFLIPNEDLSDDTTPSVARKFLNEVKSPILTLQHVVKQRMTIETHNWASSAHQELHKIVRDENFPIVNQVDARLQNFEIQFLMESAKFVGDLKSLANKADESLTKHKALEFETKRLLKAVVSQDIMIIVQNKSVVDTSDLQTELELYKDMQQKIERLQAQLGDLKGKSKDISSVSDTQNPLSQKLENKNVTLKFQVLNYARENAYIKATYKNLFDSISVSRAQTKTIIASLQNELQSNFYKNAKLRTQLFKKVSDQKDNTQDTSENTKFAKQPIVENLPKIGKTNALSKPVTSNSVSTPQESKGVNNDKVIAPGMFRINPEKTSREAKKVPNTVRASNRTKPITVSQPPVFTRKDVNSNLNGLSSTGVDNTKTRRPQPRSNTKNDREVISNVVCAMCSKCLISVNHVKCLYNYVNDKNSRGKKQMAKVSVKEIQQKYQPKVTKPKKVGTRESLATPKPRKFRLILRWSPTGRLFNQEGKLVDLSESKSKYDCSNGNLKLFINFVWKFMGTVRFGNDNVAAILGFGDLQWGNILITRFYFVEELGHNLFSVGQFCDSDLEVAFRRNACFVRNLEGVDLLKGDRSTNLYTINLHEMASASPICLMARASSTKSWLWHQRLSHLNFDTINNLARNDLVLGLPKFKYHKEHLCPLCEQGKSKRASHPPKPVPNSRQRLHLLHMDLCGPMRIASINGKRYVLVIVNDYSRYTWVHFLRSKDEAPENDREDIGKLGAKGDIGFFIGSKPELQSMTSGHISSGLDLTYAPSTITKQQPSEGELDLLFEAMYDDYIGGQPSATARFVPLAQEPQDVDKLNPNDMVDGNTFVNPFANSSTSAAASSSSQNVDPSNMHTESENQSDCSKGDNACTFNPVEPTIKRFPNSTFSLA